MFEIPKPPTKIEKLPIIQLAKLIVPNNFSRPFEIMLLSFKAKLSFESGLTFLFFSLNFLTLILIESFLR